MEHLGTNLLAIILMAAIVIAILFALMVLIVMCIGKKSAQEATKIIVDFFASICKAFQTPDVQAPCITYDVFIGHNGYIIRDDIVNEYFAPLQNYWETFYYSDAKYASQNVVEYAFRAYFPTKFENSSRRLLASVKQIAEQALTRHFHSFGVSFPVDRFIAVKIHQDIVSVFIAVNDKGFSEIEKLRQNIC
ncbi:hypothetical protein [Roseburia sp. 499]|uniref:hypothetical protein n=1 Tax=Roseburia sp. 499 TaxID=1261634 RepID=UPI000952596B|nr:hypothetical protein [Roseburia sp. 499]WVK69501.1 hypothetical protein BIV20_14235 [Roseburia sp. 499]